jgi:hypothetical protein
LKANDTTPFGVALVFIPDGYVENVARPHIEDVVALSLNSEGGVEGGVQAGVDDGVEDGHDGGGVIGPGAANP